MLAAPDGSLLAAAVYLALRLCLLHRQIDALGASFQAHLAPDTNTLLTVSTGDRHLRGLTVVLNQAQTEHPFDHIYTAETARSSTGLRLSIAKLLTEEISGVITAGYEEGQLRIRVAFPQEM